MQTRYFLERSSRVPNAGTDLLRVALPIYHEMRNDLCLCCIGSSDFVALNASVLRQALLANPEKTKELLGINVTDALIPDSTIEQKEVKKK